VTVQERTLIAAWVIQVSAAFDELYPALGPNWALKQANVDTALLGNPNARVPSSQVSKFYEIIEAITVDSTVGLKVAERLTPVSLHALGYSVLASKDLQDFFEHLALFFNLVSDCALAHIKSSDDALFFNFEVSEHRPPAREDSFLAAVVRFARMVHKPTFAPKLVKLRRPAKGADVGAFEAFFSCPVEFGQARPAIHISRVICDEPLRGANPELVRQNDQIVLNYLAQGAIDSTIRKIERIIRNLLPGDISLSKVARELGMSERALQRHLKAQDTSFLNLINEARQALALEYLRSRSFSIKEISYMLGYTKPGNFSRAFRRSNGVSPLEFCSTETTDQAWRP